MQTGGLLKELTVAETVQLTACSYAQSRPVDEVLGRAGILDISDRLRQQMLRRTTAPAICDGVAVEPQLLILDEPTTGMDVEGRRDFWSAIRADADHGRTVLFATHYLEEADVYADRIILVRQGTVVADGTTAEVKAMASGRTPARSSPRYHRRTAPSHTELGRRRGAWCESLLVHRATPMPLHGFC